MSPSYEADLAYPRRVVVDDTDSRIRYDTGTWDLDISSFNSYGHWGYPYNKTLRGTKSRVASFTFTFEGKYISVKGVKDNSKIARPDNSSTEDSLDLLPKWTCELDGTFAIETRKYNKGILDTSDIRLCEQRDLTRGRHTLKVNVSVTDPNTQVFWLDSIEYAPLDSANLPVNEVVRVDSSDARSCSYRSTTKWKDDHYGNFTQEGGATMSFKFNGTSASLYGILQPADPSGRFLQDSADGYYSIDNAESIPFTIPGAKPFPSDQTGNDTDWWNELFFETSQVESGREHEILITYTGAPNGQKPPQPLYIDYFLIVNDWVPGNGSTSPEPNSGLTEKGKKPVGAIIGGVVGGVLSLIVIIGLSWYLLKRQIRRENKVLVHPGNVVAFTKIIEEPRLGAVPSAQHNVPRRAQDSGMRSSTATLPPIYTAQ